MENSQKGFIPVMLTPFLSNGNIDYPALTQLTEIYLQAGSSGLFANCLSSEMFELTGKERIQAIKHVIKVVNGAVPVVATGTFGGAISEQADFVKEVSDTGVEAVIAITSLLAEENETDEVFNERVFNLLEQTDKIPLGFYECPVPYKRVLKPQQLADFVSTGRVIYHKDTCLDLGQIKEKLKLTEGRAFGLYDAYIVHAVESLKAGASGLSCIQGNYFPELIVWLCDHYNDEAFKDEVQVVQQFLIDNMDVMHNVYPVVSKYFLQKRGLNISTFTRRNVGSFTPSVVKEVETLFDDYTLLRNNLNIKVFI
ncbi:4-hydroxy-tetrahydrodipicolinate synthase [Pedobacter sp. Bi27]|uniref:dihydrodipicolinate synthase family protein n=1 Tax=unclassified Pedobacter TaxID=2628915 RepID=UPI001D2FC47D|nr:MULTISPECIES: dihydrodipicolinate synthase family protein [unclassified Pedobacter]CAH0138439.1 4-hydroxy-tetrahydrodipicolinate synthase [Pedobacter sp. Bi36]CAH0194193.1 4-hydroxy-tetrahydrodipicolinate synthase [Pedobacter sp. Bi126]CAH0253237.1 4-hydroxy-tetrahydrodipicolinate synthase [Pedobacter sp. Bi27]